MSTSTSKDSFLPVINVSKFLKFSLPPQAQGLTIYHEATQDQEEASKKGEIFWDNTMTAAHSLLQYSWLPDVLRIKGSVCSSFATREVF